MRGAGNVRAPQRELAMADASALAAMEPKNILLIKSHSMGLGDLLRSSAAWAALKARWPQAHLHFCMLSNHEGYVAQDLIASHHLLSSVHFITAKAGKPGGAPQHHLPLQTLMARILSSLGPQPIDLVIDCEMAGIRTALVTRRIAQAKLARSVGVAQFPLRRFFYDLSAPSSRAYQKRHGLSKPMDYTERDFVALAALGIERAGRPINLRLSPKGLAWKQRAGPEPAPGHKLVVLNIGCGTADALIKRPVMAELLDGFVALSAAMPIDLHLIGAGFEVDVNAEFMERLCERLALRKLTCAMKNWAGQLAIEESAALIDCAELVVSSDSGPYHIAVALGLPTLCWFNFHNPSAVHIQTKVTCMIRPSAQEFCTSALALLNFGSDE